MSAAPVWGLGVGEYPAPLTAAAWSPAGRRWRARWAVGAASGRVIGGAL